MGGGKEWGGGNGPWGGGEEWGGGNGPMGGRSSASAKLPQPRSRRLQHGARPTSRPRPRNAFRTYPRTTKCHRRACSHARPLQTTRSPAGVDHAAEASDPRARRVRLHFRDALGERRDRPLDTAIVQPCAARVCGGARTARQSGTRSSKTTSAIVLSAMACLRSVECAAFICVTCKRCRGLPRAPIKSQSIAIKSQSNRNHIAII